MGTPNMAAVTASLERSLQNCSLNHQQSIIINGSDSPENLSLDGSDVAAPALELNSEGSLPYNWEQCLDLKTGEIYFINWRTGMKAKEDPRKTAAYYTEDDDSSSYGSEGSSSESSPSSSREQWSGSSKNNSNIQENCYYEEKKEEENNDNNNSGNSNNNVLVVGGCKSCLMYYMVPKQLEICPKCCGQLLHFDRSENGSS